jgi:hypothetical protein
MAVRLLPLNIGELCAHALELERACERRLGEYAMRMGQTGERTLAMAFDRMAHALRRDITELETGAGERKPAKLSPWEYAWRLTYMPEAVDDQPRFVPANPREALQCAVQARRRAGVFYEDVAENAADPVVRAVAAEMAATKHAMQQRLERMLAREILAGVARRPMMAAVPRSHAQAARH